MAPTQFAGNCFPSNYIDADQQKLLDMIATIVSGRLICYTACLTASSRRPDRVRTNFDTEDCPTKRRRLTRSPLQRGLTNVSSAMPVASINNSLLWMRLRHNVAATGCVSADLFALAPVTARAQQRQRADRDPGGVEQTIARCGVCIRRLPSLASRGGLAINASSRSGAAPRRCLSEASEGVTPELRSNDATAN
jgi:hypothetical protein